MTHRMPIPRIPVVLLWGLASIGLAGCATPPADQTAPPQTQVAPDALSVPIAPDVVLTLPAPSTLGRSVEAIQLITARHGGDSFTFEGRLSVTPETVTLVGSDMLGRRAITLQWNGQTLVADQAPWLPATLPARNILADILLLYWPEDSLRPHLHGAGIAVAVLPDGSLRRTLSRDGQILIDIRQRTPVWSMPSSLSNTVWSYRLEIQSQEVSR